VLIINVVLAHTPVVFRLLQPEPCPQSHACFPRAPTVTYLTTMGDGSRRDMAA
jgi:hypothetical protein